MANSEWVNAPHIDSYRLDRKVAVVTGGAQGIGESCAHALVEAGAQVIIVGRDESKLKYVVNDLNKFGTADYFVADISELDEISKLTTFVKDKYRVIHILINNAAIGQWKPATDITLADWELMIRTNLTSIFLLSQQFGGMMIEKNYGKIVNVSSISGLIVNSEHDHVHYGTSKAGVIHLTKSLAAEWAKFGVRVNCITPGYTSTKMLQELLDTPEGRNISERISKLTPIGHMAETTDVSQGVLFFSAPASDYITGQILSVDGGYTLW